MLAIVVSKSLYRVSKITTIANILNRSYLVVIAALNYLQKKRTSANISIADLSYLVDLYIQG